MLVTERHARGYNAVGAAGGWLEPVHGFRVLAECQRCEKRWKRDPELGEEWRPVR